MVAPIRVAVASPPIEARRWATCRSTPGAANRARRRSRNADGMSDDPRSPAGPWARALLRRSSSRKNGMPSLRSMARSSSTRPRRRPSGRRWASSSSSDGESRSSGSWRALGQGGVNSSRAVRTSRTRGTRAVTMRLTSSSVDASAHWRSSTTSSSGARSADAATKSTRASSSAPWRRGPSSSGRGAPRRRRDLEQVGEQRDRRRPAHDLHHVPQPGQRVVGSLARVDAGRPLEQAAHREQRGGAVVGRAVRHQGGPIVGLDATSQHVSQARLPHPRLAREGDRAVPPGPHLVPGLDQRRDLCRPPHERAQIGLGLHPRLRLRLGHHLIGPDRIGQALQLQLAQRSHEEPPSHQLVGVLAHHERARRGVVLEAGGQVRRLPDDGVAVGRGRRTHVGQHDHPGVHGDADRQLDAVPQAHLLGDGAERLEQVEAGRHGPAGVVLVGYGMAEVGEDPVADEPGDAPVVAADRLVTGGLVGAKDLAHELWVALVAERGGADDVAEHDGELAPLAVGRRGAVGPLEEAPGLGAVRIEGQRGAGEVSSPGPVLRLHAGRGVDQQVAHTIVEPPPAHGSKRRAGPAPPVRRW